MAKKLKIEISDTFEKRAKGLMHRKHLPSDQGMLFIFSHKDFLSFWMKSTYIPLDIAFLHDDGEIFQIEKMYPLNYRAIVSNAPCKLALEVNQGWFEANKVYLNDYIDLSITSNKFKKIAQNQIEEIIPQAEQGIDEREPSPQEADQQNPKVEAIMADKEKISHAEKNNLKLEIIYRSEQSGQVLPPRILMPVPNEGYPFGSSASGEYFTGFDISPNIYGNGWEIMGNTTKRFLINNIISLSVVENV